MKKSTKTIERHPLPASNMGNVRTLKVIRNSTVLDRYARPGRVLTKVARKEILKDKGKNLLTL